MSNKTLDVDLSATLTTSGITWGKGGAQGERRRRAALLKKIPNGKKGVPQGGVISPLLSNVYLNEVDRTGTERNDP